MMNKLKTLTLIIALFPVINGYSQINIQQKTNSKNVFEIQRALGNTANYFTITNYLDSVFRYQGLATDTAEDGDFAKYKKWNWFWKGRVSNKDNLSNRGDFGQYLELMDNYAQSASSGCPQNQTPIQYNWELKGPIQLSTQNMGRVDVVRTLPSSPTSTVAFAGASTSGLWRTIDYTVAQPAWENITDNINMPNLGISDMVIDSNNTNTAYIVGEYTSWSEFSLGLYKTTNLNASPPTWEKVLGGPNNVEFTYSIGKVLLGSNSQNVFVQRDNDIYQSTDAGVSFNLLVDVQTLTGNTNLTTTGYILDKYNTDIIYIATTSTTGGNLWKFDVNNQTTLTPITLSYPAYSKIQLDNGQNGTYVIYDMDSGSADNARQYSIDKTTNSGTTWVNHVLINTTYSLMIYDRLNIFEVSDANDAIIYTEGGNQSNGMNRRITKSLDGGNTFIIQYSYYIAPSAATHPDVRGIYMLNPSNDGMSDEFFMGNDGGVSFSDSSNNQTSGHKMYWQNKNGTGLAITEFYGLGQTLKDNDVYAGGAQDNGMLRNYLGVWNVDISGDGYETFFKKNEPNKSLRLDGLGWSAKYSYSNDFLSTTLNVSYINDIAIANNSCKTQYFRQSIIEVDNQLYTSFHDVHKSVDDGANFQKISNFTNPSYGIPDNHIIEAIAVSHQDTNIIYAGYGQPTWGRDMSTLTTGCTSPTNFADTCSNCPIAKKLYKTTDGGASWVDISANFDTGTNPPYGPRWFGITDMVVSPTDDNTLFVAFDQIGDVSNFECGGFDRVDVTYDGGTTWEDYSNNLPFLPINKIVYYEGTNDGLFVGTDIGVYYTDADLYPIEGWIKVSNGLPATIVADLDINYCRGIIRIATYGRGIWEAELQAPYQDNTVEITSNTTWNSDKNVINTIKIKNGVTLTINNNAVINIAKDKKIIVEQGGKLIVDGATLTNQCEQLWEGIEVWGDISTSQFDQNTHAYLEIKNGALIENAHEAVKLHQTFSDGSNNYFSTGGIVVANNSTFKNNTRSFEFLSYQNTFPSNPSVLVNDLSSIKNCSFIYDDTGNMVTLGRITRAHVSMWDVHGVILNNNTYTNDAPYSTYGVMDRGIGIVSFDADYRVSPLCTSGSYPCTAFDESEFNNLTYGIKAESSNNFNNIVVKHANFTNCFRGIYLKNMSYPEIVNSSFDIASEFLGNPSYGIYLDNCSGYEIEENNFLTTAGNATYGIYTKASGTTANEIYNNQLNDLQIANQTEGENGTSPIDPLPNGLIFRCNQNSNTSTADIAVTTGVVNKNQGSCANNLSPTNNLFAGTATYDIWLDATMPTMDYFYSSGNTQLVPTNNFPFGAVITTDCNTSTFNQSVNCPSRQQVILTPPVLLANIGVLSTGRKALTDPIDNGNTKALLLLINGTTPNWQIRNELMAASPYLSEQVLVAMLNRTPALPNWVIQQVLNANAPLTDQVFLAMLQRQPALPPHIVHQLALASSPLSKDEQLALLTVTPALPNWVLTSIFIENSPLFDEVLFALMEHTPKIANWSIRNIFIRNTPLSDAVADELTNNNYPNWVINSINHSPFVAGDAINKPQPLSPLLELYNEISAVNHEIQLTENELFRTYLHDTTGTYGVTDVIAYLKQREHSDDDEATCCAKKLACAFIKNKEHLKAQNTIDSLRQDSSLTDFCNFHTAINELEQATPSTIDSTTNAAIKQTIESVANSTSAGREKAGAEALLQFAGLANFSETFVPLNANLRMKPTDGNPAPGTVQLLNPNYKDDVIKVYPNPNNGQFYVEYDIETMQTGSFVLTDLLGKEILRKPLQNNKRRLEVKEQIIPGIYLYQIIVNGETYSVNKLVINNQ